VQKEILMNYQREIDTRTNLGIVRAFIRTQVHFLYIYTHINIDTCNISGCVNYLANAENLQ